MPFKSGLRRAKSADATRLWSEKFETLYAADHPGCPSQYDTYVNYIAFLTSGIIEHHWAEGVKAHGRAPFVPLGRDEGFLLDLHKQMRAFRESRHIDGLSSPELVKHSYELLGFLGERVPSDKLEQFLAAARLYIMQHEDECLSSQPARDGRISSLRD